MFARIYRPARTATQSGMARARKWVLEYAPETRRAIDPLMGWTGSDDMRSQVRLLFEDRESAARYAEKHGIPYRIEEPQGRDLNVRARGYGANFAADRREGWTH